MGACWLGGLRTYTHRPCITTTTTTNTILVPTILPLLNQLSRPPLLRLLRVCNIAGLAGWCGGCPFGGGTTCRSKRWSSTHPTTYAHQPHTRINHTRPSITHAHTLTPNLHIPVFFHIFHVPVPRGDPGHAALAAPRTRWRGGGGRVGEIRSQVRTVSNGWVSEEG